MSILNVVGAKVWGGGEQYVYDMCDELHRRQIPSLTGAKLIFYKHNVVHAKTDMYHRWIQSQVDAFICVSKRVYDVQVIADIAHKYHLVYNGVNTQRFPVLENESISTSPFIVGYAGRIIENKGIFELLDAIKIIHDRDRAILLRICGDGKPSDIERMHQYIAEHKMQDYVQYIGFQNDMNQFYRSIHCLVAPSKVQEAFGLVLCEAMYCKVPVITSTSGAIIENGTSGILLETVNSTSIADAMQGMIINDVFRESIINEGYKRVESTFTITKMVDSIVTIVRNLR